jgi:AcrR family transcriptional regulator
MWRVDTCRRPHFAANAFELTAMAVRSPPQGSVERLDGRRMRSERTRQVVMDAYMALLRESPEIPTAASIAERAGVSTRLIFERFTDLQTLSLATMDYAFATAESQAVVRDSDGDRPARLRSHVETRGNTCERWLPLWRVVIVHQAKFAELRERVDFVRQAVMKRMELMYRPELSVLAGDERRDLLIALESLTDFESWGRMREQHGLSFDEACSVWMRIIDRMLPATPVVDHDD